MPCVAFRGIRGGVGTTATVAAIGDALHALGETVLMIDLAAENLLRLHVGVPHADRRGWARAQCDGTAWHQAAYEVKPGLHLLPFGVLSPAERAAVPQASDDDWPGRLARLAERYGMILIDVPARGPGMSWLSGVDLSITTAEADFASHALLESLPHDDDRKLLITRFDPTSALQGDIRSLWRSRLGPALIPQVMHRDEAMAEALGHAMPVCHYRPHSLSAQDASSVATWCLAQSKARP